MKYNFSKNILKLTILILSTACSDFYDVKAPQVPTLPKVDIEYTKPDALPVFNEEGRVNYQSNNLLNSLYYKIETKNKNEVHIHYEITSNEKCVRVSSAWKGNYNLKYDSIIFSPINKDSYLLNPDFFSFQSDENKIPRSFEMVHFYVSQNPAILYSTEPENHECEKSTYNFTTYNVDSKNLETEIDKLPNWLESDGYIKPNSPIFTPNVVKMRSKFLHYRFSKDLGLVINLVNQSIVGVSIPREKFNLKEISLSDSSKSHYKIQFQTYPIIGSSNPTLPQIKTLVEDLENFKNSKLSSDNDMTIQNYFELQNIISKSAASIL